MTRHLVRSAVLAAACLASAACDATSPQGQSSSLSARAYVDADGSGTFNTGDVPIAGATIEAVPRGGGAALQATTDANGLATFTEVEPGTYTLRFNAASPQGVVLASATEPTVAAQFTGGELSAEFRFTYVPTGVILARRQAQGTVVTLDGVVTVPQGAFGTTTIFIQDRFAGIRVFRVPAGLNLQLGDSVRVRGQLRNNAGELQVDSVAFGLNAEVTRVGTGTVPAPRVLANADVLNARTYEGQLVRINNVEVTTVQTGTAAAFNVTFRDTAGVTFTVRVAGAGTGLTRAAFTVGRRYDVVGVPGSFNGAAQLFPRMAADLTAR